MLGWIFPSIIIVQNQREKLSKEKQKKITWSKIESAQQAIDPRYSKQWFVVISSLKYLLISKCVSRNQHKVFP